MTKKQNEEAPATNTSSIPNPADTAMGPKFSNINVMDRRKKKRPDVLKNLDLVRRNYHSHNKKHLITNKRLHRVFVI